MSPELITSMRYSRVSPGARAPPFRSEAVLVLPMKRGVALRSVVAVVVLTGEVSSLSIDATLSMKKVPAATGLLTVT